MWFFGFLAYLSFIPLCLSLVFIDITPFKFPKEGKTGLRILTFDVNKQQIMSLRYVPIKTKRSLKDVAFEDDQFVVNYEGNVLLKKGFDAQKMALATFGTLQGMQKKHTPLVMPKRPLEALLAVLKGRTPEAKNLRVHYLVNGKTEGRTLTHISPDLSTNNKERGFVGERVTEITFLVTTGAGNQEAQNASNQGLDGVFLVPNGKDKAWIFLTESKCRNESKRARIYMESDLSEERILKRIQEIPNQKFQAWILSALDARPDYVFKLVQRLLPSGHVESYMDQLNPVLYYYHRLKDHMEPPHKKKIQAAFLRAVLGHLNLPKDQAGNLLEKRGTRTHG